LWRLLWLLLLLSWLDKVTSSFPSFRLSKLGSHALPAADTHPMDGRASGWYWAGAAFGLIAVKRFGGLL